MSVFSSEHALQALGRSTAWPHTAYCHAASA